jgi:hypothetical protein
MHALPPWTKKNCQLLSKHCSNVQWANNILILCSRCGFGDGDRLLASVLTPDLEDLIAHSTIDAWQDTLAALLTYAPQADIARLCSALAAKVFRSLLFFFQI